MDFSSQTSGCNAQQGKLCKSGTGRVRAVPPSSHKEKMPLRQVRSGTFQDFQKDKDAQLKRLGQETSTRDHLKTSKPRQSGAEEKKAAGFWNWRIERT